VQTVCQVGLWRYAIDVKRFCDTPAAAVGVGLSKCGLDQAFSPRNVVGKTRTSRFLALRLTA
jgi:hypothetical protein